MSTVLAARMIRRQAIPLMMLSLACGSDGATDPGPQPKPFTVGRNNFTTPFNGDSREYIVSVPASYDGLTAAPVVFMLHGSSGDGLRFYNNSGWKELGETQRIITVYPTSWMYCVFDDEDGQQRVTTKWNNYGLPNELCPNTSSTLRDDVGFLRRIISELQNRYVVDATKIYVAGFSNGGGMAARAGVEMSDVLAAVAGTGGTLGTTARAPLRKLPISLTIGERDDRFTAAAGVNPIPMDFPTLFANPVFGALRLSYTTTFGLNTTYSTSGSVSTVNTATFLGASGTAGNRFELSIVKNLTHQYPNGNNHAMKGAEVHWAFFSPYRLP